MTSGARGHEGARRAALLDLLRASGTPLSAAELASRAGLAVTTVRFHLDHLAATGAVTATSGPARGPGRPARLYRAVPAEAVEDGAAYRLLAGLLAEQLVRSGGAQASLEAGHRWADSLPLPDQGDALAAVAHLLADGGFAPEVVDDSTVLLHRCPFIDLAREQSAAVCTVHLGLVQGVLDRIGSPARPRLDVVLDGSRPCAVRLGPPGPPD